MAINKTKVLVSFKPKSGSPVYPNHLACQTLLDLNFINYKGKEVASWYDYLQTKFADNNLFYIEKNKTDWIISNSNNSTTISFIGISDQLLNDCQYHSEKCKGWSGETIIGNANKFGIFNQENMERIEKILEAPIYKGWISIDYYLFDRYFKSKTYPNKDLAQKPFTNLGSRIGCIQILLFPVIILLNILVNRNIIGRNEKVIVDPIIV